ncbi:MAG TPA: response regulator transcription factor [Bryobacteraceae bacterium]|jgi:DNA-binding response OmpR family regulator|nr:response regulator transcription factor [Bryobacteraceae bacterium]
MMANSSEKILIVEDEQHLADGLRFNLEAEGYQVRAVDTGEAALDLLLPASGNGAPEAAKHAFDIIVLDVMLPGKNGFEVISELRQAKHFVPTIILTARGRPEDVLEGFAAGADDYLPKPFELAILIARIRGLLRRKEWLRASAPPPEPQDSFVFGDKSIHFDLLELRVREQIYPLTVMEASVLRYLVEHQGQTVSRKTMLKDVWGLHGDTDTRAIDNFIVRLRRYLEDDATRPRHLLTVRGVGYRFIAFPPG